MDKQDFEQTIKLTELFYEAKAEKGKPVEQFENLINDIADFYIEKRKSNKVDDSWIRYNAIVNMFADAVKIYPDLAFKKDVNGNTFMHKMAKAGFWSVCLSAVVDAPNSIYVKNNEGQTYVDVYGAASLKGSCAKILRLSGGASEELKEVYKILDKVYPEVEEPYNETVEEYLSKQSNEEK